MMNEENTVWKLIKDLSHKKGITEIAINKPDLIFVEREGQFIQLSVKVEREDLLEFVQEVAKFNREECSEEVPVFDGRLPDGSRINIVNEPIVTESPAITIRKFLKKYQRFDSEAELFGLNEQWTQFMKAAVSARLNILVSGGTGVGKTTFLNMLLNEVPSGERIVVIEDTRELSISIPNSVRLESGMKITSQGGPLNITTRLLVKNSLRMRPDRIIVGEVRGEEFFDLLQSMNTGHEGSMSSIHANSASECFSRMESLFLLAGYDVPSVGIKKQISDAIDIIIQLGRDREGKRVVNTITEITGTEGGNILSQVLASHEQDQLRFTGIASKNMEKLHRMGGLKMDFFNN